jgi:hypothetical protein
MNRLIANDTSGARVLRHALTAAGVLLLCGCSSFNRAWREAAAPPVGAPSIEGRWEGRWLSDVNGHTGRLRCLLSRNAETNYTARFRATYWKVFRYSYSVNLHLDPQGDGVWRLDGSEDLGALAGGVYRYVGRVTPTNFFSTYESTYDHGTFQMNRPP